MFTVKLPSMKNLFREYFLENFTSENYIMKKINISDSKNGLDKIVLYDFKTVCKLKKIIR